MLHFFRQPSSCTFSFCSPAYEYIEIPGALIRDPVPTGKPSKVIREIVPHSAPGRPELTSDTCMFVYDLAALVVLLTSLKLLLGTLQPLFPKLPLLVFLVVDFALSLHPCLETEVPVLWVISCPNRILDLFQDQSWLRGLATLAVSHEHVPRRECSSVTVLTFLNSF